jgi:hypothetical protein
MVVSTYSSGSYGSSGVSISAARDIEENEMLINNTSAFAFMHH